MKLKQLLKHLLVAAAMLSAVDAAVASVTSTISAGIRGSQQGRLIRNALPQDWAGSEAYPGINNPTVTFFYSTFVVFVGSLNYLEIDFDSLSANTFVSAYQTSYNPLSPSTNYLGDVGSSGNSFNGTDIGVFNVIGTLGSYVTIVVNNTTAGLGLNEQFTLSVYGFPDASGGDNPSYDYSNPRELAVTRVPEPSTLLLLLAPLGLVAGRKLRVRRNTMGALAAA